MKVALKVIDSAYLSVSASLLGKAFGLLSTLIVARILAPSDFGVIALTAMALYFFDILSHAAGEQYILQKRTVSKQDLDSAWTLNLILKVVVAYIVIASAEFVSDFFTKPQLALALTVCACVLPLQALKNPRLILLKRQLKYRVVFWTTFIEKLISFISLILLAYWLGNFWAFIFTDIIVALCSILLSFIFIDGKVRVTLSEFKLQWNFSKWMFSKSIVGYIRSQIDTFFVAKFFSSSQLGGYHLARDIAMMPAHYITTPAISTLLAVFKNDRENRAELLNNLAFSLIIVLFFTMPICFITILLHKPLTLLLLGKQWEFASSLLSVLIYLFVYWSILSVLESAVVAAGKVRVLFYFDVFSLLFITLSMLYGVINNFELEDLAWTRVVSGVIPTLILLIYSFRTNLAALKPIFLTFVYVIFVLFVIYSITDYAIDIENFYIGVFFFDLLSIGFLSLSILLVYVLSIAALFIYSDNCHYTRARALFLNKYSENYVLKLLVRRK